MKNQRKAGHKKIPCNITTPLSCSNRRGNPQTEKSEKPFQSPSIESPFLIKYQKYPTSLKIKNRKPEGANPTGIL